MLASGLASAATLTESFTTIPQTSTDFNMAIVAAGLNCNCTITEIDLFVSASLTSSLSVTAGGSGLAGSAATKL